MAALPQQIAHAQKASPAFASILAGVDASTVTSRDALAQLPVTRKYELLERQQELTAHEFKSQWGRCGPPLSCGICLLHLLLDHDARAHSSAALLLLFEPHP